MAYESFKEWWPEECYPAYRPTKNGHVLEGDEAVAACRQHFFTTMSQCIARNIGRIAGIRITKHGWGLYSYSGTLAQARALVRRAIAFQEGTTASRAAAKRAWLACLKRNHAAEQTVIDEHYISLEEMQIWGAEDNTAFRAYDRSRPL